MIELAAPPSAGPTEISKIAFDDQGRMFLAERPAPTGAFDLEALAVPAIGRVLRYAIVGAAPRGRRVWQEQADEYAIGFAGDLRNGNGGLDFGYAYDREGEIDRSSCGGYLWSTGEDLRNSPAAALALRLSQTGTLHVRGLQGAGTWQDRPRNVPPLESYFISYIDQSADDAARGTLGDVAIERACAPPTRAGVLAPPPSGAVLPPAAPASPPIASAPAGPPPAPLARRPPNRQARRRQPRPENRPARLRLAAAPPIRSAASAPGRASRTARDQTFRSAANAASSANSRRAAHARIQAAQPERRQSGPAISAATAIRSTPPPAGRRRAAAARSSTAAVCRRRQVVRRARRARAALFAPPGMCRPAARAVSPAW